MKSTMFTMFALVVAGGMCGCETIPAVYLGEIVHSVMGTQADLHKTGPSPGESADSSTPTGASPSINRMSTSVSSSVQNRTAAGASDAHQPVWRAPSTPPARPIPESRVETYSVQETPVDALWAEYRAFHYETVLYRGYAFSRQDGIFAAQRAIALILAGSSAYILGNDGIARELLGQAAAIAPDIRPNPEVFPTEVCQWHERFAHSQP